MTHKHPATVAALTTLSPYQSADTYPLTLANKSSVLKLDCNEATVEPSPVVVSALQHFVQTHPLHWYPDVESQALREALTGYTDLPYDSIQTFNGCDNALEYITRTYLDTGDEVVIAAPTYDNFRVYAHSCGAKIVPVLGENPFDKKLNRLVEAITPRTKMLYLVNPNNPTGTLYTLEEIKILLDALPQGVVLIDEAYFEFCGQTAAPLVRQYPNLFVTRSFSKAFGLAGLRCGYILSQPENIQEINKIRVGKNINALAQFSAITALSELAYTRAKIVEMRETETWLAEALSDFSLEVVTTPANFMMIRVAHPEAVQHQLKKYDIFVRDRSYLPQLEGFLRITVGPREIMERFVETWTKLPTHLLWDADRPATVATLSLSTQER